MSPRVKSAQIIKCTRIEAQFTALRHFALDGTDHASHHHHHQQQQQQGNMLCRYIIWRNNHACERLRRIIDRVNVA